MLTATKNTLWVRQTQKLLLCIRSCETIPQLNCCEIMYKRILKTTIPEHSHTSDYIDTMASLLEEVKAKYNQILEVNPAAFEVARLKRYENNAKV